MRRLPPGGEEPWAKAFRTGPLDAPAYWFTLDFLNVPDESVDRVRTDAERLLHIHDGHRLLGSLLRTTAQSIAHLCTVRLVNRQGAPANVWLVQATYDDEEPEDLIQGDRARIMTWAWQRSEDSTDPDAALVWGQIWQGFTKPPMGKRRPAA